MDQMGTTVLICPECGNNMCLLHVEIFAKKHLKGANKKIYETMKKDIDIFLFEKMEEHRRRIMAEYRNPGTNRQEGG